MEPGLEPNMKLDQNSDQVSDTIRVNLLELHPVRLSQWKERKGQVAIVAPRFRSKFGQRIARLLRMKPHFHIRLDEYGSQVWLLMGSDRSVEELAQRLRELYGEDVEPLYERLEEFLRIMEINNIIGYRDAPETISD